MGSLSSEVGSAVEVVRKQAEALLQSVNNLIAVVKEPEVQQALIDVQAGLQRVLDKFNSTGMRDIDSLIEIVSELRDITDKLSSALQTLQNRINTETGTQGEGAADLADELQLQDSLNAVSYTHLPLCQPCGVGGKIHRSALQGQRGAVGQIGGVKIEMCIRDSCAAVLFCGIIK